jgi:hypothetical protein
VGADKWLNMKVYSVLMNEALSALPVAAEILLAAWNAAVAATGREVGNQRVALTEKEN